MSNLAAPIRATFFVRGLQGAEEALQLERLLRRHPASRRVGVYFESKCIKMEFDEQLISVQAATRIIALETIPDRNEPLEVGIFLKIPSIRNPQRERFILFALRQIREVQRVVSFPAQQAVELQLKHDGNLTTQDLLRKLSAEGIVANIS